MIEIQDRAVDEARVVDHWIRFGGYSGFIFAILFMSAAVLPLPDRVSTVAALIFPLFLLVAHVGLYQFLARREPSFTNQLAVICGICAPVLVSAMLTVQMSMAWDMFILPTLILFSLGIMKPPAFGKWFGGIGLVLGVVGLVLNIATFPIPPINTGLPDVGPFVVSWYAILFVLLIRAQRKTA